MESISPETYQNIFHEINKRSLIQYFTDKIPVFGAIKKLERLDEKGDDIVDRLLEKGKIEIEQTPCLRETISRRNNKEVQDVYGLHLLSVGFGTGLVLGYILNS